MILNLLEVSTTVLGSTADTLRVKTSREVTHRVIKVSA